MNSITFAFLLTTIAGLSTLIGIIPIYIKVTNINKVVSASLAFAAGVMASISLFSLLPESHNLLTYKKTLVLLILLGIIFSLIINKLLHNIDNKLHKLGINNLIALTLHNIPEGILTFSTTTINPSIGITLALSIIFHNIPEGISISIPIYYSTNSKIKAWIYTLISGFSETFGAIISYLILYKFINNNLIGIILSITTGIMIYISLIELLPSSVKYDRKTSYIFFIIGFVFMIVFK